MALNVYFRVVDNTTLGILQELRNYRYKSIKYWFNPKNIDDSYNTFRDFTNILHDVIDHQLTCFKWNIKQTKVDLLYDGLEHLASRHIIDNTKFVCIDNQPHTNNQIVLFQDAVHLEEYPKQFIKIPCFSSFQELIDYAVSENIFPFSLERNSEFEKTALIVQGQSVYKETRQNRFWYLDNLHKNHYEVFDNRGRHLGEADLEGNFDPGKKDKNKTLNL